MALTRDFKVTVKARADRDPEFRRALLGEAIECLLNGEVEVGQAMLRDYINATVGFEELGREVDVNPKSLHRMLGPRGNPQAKMLFPVIAHLKRRERIKLQAVAA